MKIKEKIFAWAIKRNVKNKGSSFLKEMLDSLSLEEKYKLDNFFSFCWPDIPDYVKEYKQKKRGKNV